MIETIHEVVFDSAGIPDNYNVGVLRQGTKNIDQLSMHFESYNDAERVVVIRATRGDGELAPTGLLELPRTDENTGKVWYDFIFGQQENENNAGSWFTENEDNLTLNIQLVDYDEETQKTKVYLTSQISFLIEETSGFEKGSEYTWDIIQGFLNALSLRTTYTYVDNAVNILQAQITSNESDITNLQNNKVDKTTKVNNKALQSDITLTADDIKGKDALNQEMTIQEVLDSKMDDTQLAQVIDDNEHKAPSNKAVNTVKNTLDTKIDNVENTLDTKIDGVESDIEQELDTVAYLGALSEEEELMRTVYNAEKLGGKTESELSVASALNSTKLNNKLESELSVASAVNSAKLNNKQESELNVAKAVDSDKLGGVSASEYSKKNIVLFNGEHKSKDFLNEDLKNNVVSDGRIEVIPYYEKYKRVKLEFKDGPLALDYNYDETMGEKVLKFHYDFKYPIMFGDGVAIVRKGIFYVVLNYKTLQSGENPPSYAFYPKTITNCQFLDISDEWYVEKPVPTEVYVSISKTDTQLIINDIRFNTIVEFSTIQDIRDYYFTITKIEEIRG